MTAPVGIQIQFNSTFGTSEKIQFLLADVDTAKKVFDALHEGIRAYHDRANDRQRMLTFEHLTGQALVDASTVCAIGIDDALGEHREELEAWNIGLAEISGKARAAGSAFDATPTAESSK